MLDIAEEAPIKDFDRYVKAASAIIKNTEARFSIGIYGEGETGKTTMMKGIEKEIVGQNKLIAVWFDAWRYENEEHHAAVPLLKKIAYSIENDPNFKTLADKIKTVAGIISKDIVSEFVSKYIANVDVKTIKKEFDEKRSIRSQYEKNTIYYDGLKEISKEIEKDSEKKIVIFIDDLDRCSPEKTIQVLESTMAFLDIKGFVFVIGLSHDTTAKRIKGKYKDSDIKGEDYIKKIIQVPFNIQTWNKTDTIDLIKNMTRKVELFHQTIAEKEDINKKLIITHENNQKYGEICWKMGSNLDVTSMLEITDRGF